MPRRLATLLLSTILAAALAACGGGGGRDVGSESSQTPAEVPQAPATPPTAQPGQPDKAPEVSSPKISVRQDGNLGMNPDITGAYRLVSNVRVFVSSSGSLLPHNVRRITVSNPSGHIRLLGETTYFGSWNALPVNDSATEQSFSVTVDYFDGAAEASETLVMSVAPRNPYVVYSGTGSKLLLDTNSTAGTFQFEPTYGIDPSSCCRLVSDGFAPGFIRFAGMAAESAFNPKRAREVADGVLVGMYALNPGFASTASAKMHAPFVAVKQSALLTTQSDLTGVYNFAELNTIDGMAMVPTTTAARVGQISISANGTKLTACNEVGTISRIDSCAGPLLTYTGVLGTPTDFLQRDVNEWVFTNDADPNDKVNFGAVRINGQVVLLQASRSPNGNVFRVALPDAAQWPGSAMQGGDDKGIWNSYQWEAGVISGSGKGEAGVAQPRSLPLSAPGANEPQGLRHVAGPNGNAYAIQGAGLSAIVGPGALHGGASIYLGSAD